MKRIQLTINYNMYEDYLYILNHVGLSAFRDQLINDKALNILKKCPSLYHTPVKYKKYKHYIKIISVCNTSGSREHFKLKRRIYF